MNYSDMFDQADDGRYLIAADELFAMMRVAASKGWELAVQSIVDEDGNPIEIKNNHNPFIPQQEDDSE